MKPSQLREWMRRYGNWGVLAAGGYLLLRRLRPRQYFALPLCGLGVLLILGIANLCFTHRSRRATKPIPVASRPIAASPSRSHLEWQPHSEAVRHQLEKAEQQISRYAPAPPKHFSEEEVSEESPWEKAQNWVETPEEKAQTWVKETPEEQAQNWAKETLESSLRIDPSGRAYADLGERAYRGNDYEDAVKQYTQALAIAPDADVAREGLIRSRNALTIRTWVETQAKRLLLKGQQLDTLFPFPVPGRTLWAALSHEVSEVHNESTGATWYELANPRITVFESEPKGGKVKVLWRSDGSDGGDGYDKLNLWAFSMTGNRIPDLVFRGVCGVCNDGDDHPSVLHIYRWNGKSFRSVLQIESDCAQWITDLRHTGSYQVYSIDQVGIEDAHDVMFYWPQIYAWNGVRFARANARYPEAFHETRDEIQELLDDYNWSWDGELWHYLGLTYLYDHEQHQARSAFEKAEKVFHNSEEADEAFYSDSDYGSWRLAELTEIRGDRRKAAYLYRQIAQHSRALAAKETDDEIQQDYHREEAQRALEHARHPHLGENFFRTEKFLMWKHHILLGSRYHSIDAP